MSIADLPASCLVHILQYVPMQQRLQDCALVSSSWAHAAASATTAITISADRCCPVLQWASMHAQHVSTLLLTAPPQGVQARVEVSSLLAAMPALQELQIQDCWLDLPPCAQYYRSSHLTKLQISASPLAGMRMLLAPLAGLSSLQRLQLHILVPALQQVSQPRPEWTFPCSLWAQLTALTHLDLGRQHNVTDAVVQSLTCLARVQELRLLAAQLTAPGLAPLEQLQHLSSLELHLAPHLAFSTSTTPVLTSLQHLELFCWRDLEPDLLASLSRLRDLNLNAWASKHSSEDAVAAFLGALSQLTGLTALQLQHVLQLQDNLLPNVGPAAPQQQLDPAACAALTASTLLQRLHVSCATLPEGVWQHTFPTGRLLPNLRELQLSGITALLGDAELLLLVQACPGLTALLLKRALQTGVSLAPLLQLKQLRDLELQHIHGDSESGVLAQLTGLVRLHDSHGHLSAQGLLKLTALRQLTHLHIHCSSRHDWVPQLISLSNTAPDWLVPNVWSQLLQRVSE